MTVTSAVFKDSKNTENSTDALHFNLCGLFEGDTLYLYIIKLQNLFL